MLYGNAMKPNTKVFEKPVDSGSVAARGGKAGVSRCQAPAEPGRVDDQARIHAARAAFRDYHARCFWHMRPDLAITIEDIPVIARGLRQNGGRQGYLLAEQLCR
jgi:hypothetical protein